MTGVSTKRLTRPLLSMIITALVSVAVYPAPISSPPPHAVIFMYHRFGDPRYPTTNTKTSQFAAQLDWLAQHQYQVWPLRRIINALVAGKPLPDHVVAITVDGAFRSVYEHAYPLLKSRHFPFTIFVSSDDLDHRRPDFMTWDELRDIVAHGGDVGDDSADSAHLVFQRPGESRAGWSARVRNDILRGQQRLQAELGADTNTTPKLFAYPYGEFTARLATIVTQLGFIALGQESGVASVPLDSRAVPRFPINQHFGSVPAFTLRASALPMPVRSVRPWDPAVTGINPPRLTVTLEPGVIPPSALHCYLNGPALVITWLNPERSRYAIQAGSALPAGHDRYNCTARVHGRYYWYSHMWVVVPP